jgi:hypothetical protein
MRQNLIGLKFKEKNSHEFEAVIEMVDGNEASSLFEPIDYDQEDDEETGLDKFLKIEMIGLDENRDFLKINGSLGLKCSLLLPESKL